MVSDNKIILVINMLLQNKQPTKHSTFTWLAANSSKRTITCLIQKCIWHHDYAFSHKALSEK